MVLRTLKKTSQFNLEKECTGDSEPQVEFTYWRNGIEPPFCPYSPWSMLKLSPPTWEQLREVIMTGPEIIQQRQAQPGVRNGAKQPMANLSLAPRTVTWNDNPEWRRNNKHILTGYRPLKADYLQVIKSLIFLHNETCNTYTHLIGAVLLPLLVTTILRTIYGPQYINVTRTDFFMFSIFFCSADTCLIFSAVYHLIGSHPHKVEQSWHRMDLLGIVIATVGTFIPGICYIFNCEAILQKIHWNIVCHPGHPRL
ncbi:hypothetical protein FHETE_11435 [Fusarium heterosporum]|uniref:Uncharacterized protein n=1 Tax=Fusarium heterosporum TaxID=42747 RepID=A0A8H5WC74_FUSHE|nr:hypothetical protein FHETE_11435 [Fusarium heterosporum]